LQLPQPETEPTLCILNGVRAFYTYYNKKGELSPHIPKKLSLLPYQQTYVIFCYVSLLFLNLRESFDTLRDAISFKGTVPRKSVRDYDLGC
jgi:hypothetical protein